MKILRAIIDGSIFLQGTNRQVHVLENIGRFFSENRVIVVSDHGKAIRGIRNTWLECSGGMLKSISILYSR
jgi:broad specificity phosphatase PhoE